GGAFLHTRECSVRRNCREYECVTAPCRNLRTIDLTTLIIGRQAHKQGEVMLSRFGKSLVFLLTLGMLASGQTVPAGTRITVRTDSQINSASAHVGQSFNANLVRDLVLGGKTIAKAGAPAKGKVTYAKSSGRLHAPGQVTIRLTSIQLADGK